MTEITRGSLLLADLDPALGREQKGVRPCVVVSVPQVTTSQKFPLVVVIPVTGTPGAGILYPPLEPGASGLTKRSWALTDQIRCIDKRRILKAYGTLRPSELASIDEGLATFLGLALRP